MDKELPPKKMPECCDFAAAKANHPEWDSLTTRKKNALARDEMFHREYHALADAIMQTGSNRRG